VPEFKIWGVQYEVFIKAVSQGGKSRKIIIVDVIHGFANESKYSLKVVDPILEKFIKETVGMQRYLISHCK
jgi:hypothetical protein